MSKGIPLAVLEEIERLRAINAELLAALEKAEANLPSWALLTRETVRAAIAKAKS